MMPDSFPSDLTDEQWAVVEPLIPRPAGGGRRFWQPSGAAFGSACFCYRRRLCQPDPSHLLQVTVNVLAPLHLLQVAENRPDPLHLRQASDTAGLKLPDPLHRRQGWPNFWPVPSQVKHG
jgi:hypothetical protein